MRSLLFLLSPLAYLLQVQNIQVKEVRTTATQAVLMFHAPDTANCTVQIALDAAFTQPVFDSNTALFPGSQNCNRAGSVIEGNTVTFVAGLRRAQKATDNKFYSRALEANREFYYRITSGALSYDGKLTTLNPPLGKSYGETYPYDEAAPGNYAWPTIDWTDRSKEYVDPLTGIVVKRMTGPRIAEYRTTTAAAAIAALDGAGSWTTPNQGAAIDGNTAVLTAAAQDPLFIRAGVVCPAGFDCTRTARWTSVYRGIDDVQVSLKAWCASTACTDNVSGERSVDICLTVDGVSCATDWKTITAASSSAGAAVSFPSSFPSPLFAGWLGGNFQTPIARPDMGTFEGTVNTNGTAVTFAGGHLFPYDIWKAGSRIVINSIEYTIASVTNATQIVLTTDAGVQSGVAYSANNFGLLARKTNATTEPLEIDGATFRWAESQEFEMTAAGGRDFCPPVEVTETGGKTGYVCSTLTGEGYPTLWFISKSDGQANYLTQIVVPFNADTTGGAIDGNHAGCGFAADATNPNRFFCLVGSNTSPSQGLLIFRGTYHPEGRAGCSVPAGYQHNATTIQSCLLTWELMTKPSQGRRLFDMMQAFDSNFQPGAYPFMNVFTAQGDQLGMFAWAGQDTMAWSIWLDAATMNIRSMQDYHSKLPCRFCTVHSFLPLGDTKYNAVSVKDFGGGAETGSGPYEVNVTAVAGVVDGSLNTTKFDTCPTDLPQKYKDAGAVGAKCITVTVPGDPCDPSPSAWESANRTACPWKSGAVTLQPIIEGDEANDGSERFLFVRKLSNTQWILLRHYNIPHGPGMNEVTSFLQNHPAGWKLTMACAGGTGSGYVWVNFAEDTHGDNIRRDNAQSRSQHGDITGLGSVSSNYDGGRDLFGNYLWTYPIPDRIGIAADVPLYTGRTFGNINVHIWPLFRDYIQVHPSWRQVAAQGRERYWFLDGNPFAPQAGGSYTLWNQTSVNVSGSLYKLGALPAPLVRKYLPTLAWSGRHLMQDVSGPGSVLTGDAADNFKYCIADFAGECTAGSAANDVYVNIPKMSQDGLCGNLFHYNRPCVVSMVNIGIGINQYGAARFNGFNRADRYLTSQFQRYNATWTYNNAVPLPDGSWAVTSGSWLEGVRNDLLLLKIPPFPEMDSVNRADYVPLKISVGAQPHAPKVRVRFGYAENGPASSYYCTGRREACVASGSPFSWISENAAPVECAGGCTVTVPGISGRILYYVIDRMNGSNVVVDSGRRGAIAVP